MREEELPNTAAMPEEEAEAFYEGCGFADTRNSYEAIEAFDRMLKPLGYELLLYTGRSDHVFRIVPLEPNQC